MKQDTMSFSILCWSSSSLSSAEEDDEQELTYADVKIVQRQDRQRQQRADMEVEYGQVKFSGRPRQVAEPTGDDCVYAKVRIGSWLGQCFYTDCTSEGRRRKFVKMPKG